MADKDPAARAAARIVPEHDEVQIAQIIREEFGDRGIPIANAMRRLVNLEDFVDRFSSDTTGNTPRVHANQD